MSGLPLILLPRCPYSVNAQPYNKSSSRQGSFVHGQVIAPVRGEACNAMNWHEYFTYDAETGNLIWKVRDRGMFNSRRGHSVFNAKFSGMIAGSATSSCGYIQIRIGDKMVLAHRVIWEMHNGPIPKGVIIDHANGNPYDNRIGNLRLATAAQNIMNSRLTVATRSGFKGVSMEAKTQKWRSRISVNGVCIYLGLFDTPEEASSARNEKAKELHGEFARNT